MRPCTRNRPGPQAYRAKGELGLGDPAAPESNCLPLLPSGPDGIHSVSPRRTRPSTLPVGASPHGAQTSSGNSAPLKRIAGSGHR